MRKLVLILTVLLGVFMLFTTACGSGDENNDTTDPGTISGLDDLTPAVAEWAVMFVGGVLVKDVITYQVGIYWIGGATAPLVGDTAVLEVNGVPVVLTNYSPGLWFGSCEATQGENNTVKFVYNGTTKIDNSLQMVNVLTGSTFPTSYDPTQATNVSWTLPADNQHQLFGVSAYKDNYPESDWSGEYTKEIAVGARDYTIPANPIANVPAGAQYSIGIIESNYKIQNMIALMSLNGAWSDEYMKNAKPEQMELFARKILNTLTK